MAERKRIGILFNQDDEWIAGVYYIINIINGFKLIDDIKKPQISIFFWNADGLDKIKNINYPYIQYLPILIPYTFTERLLNKLGTIFFKKKLINKFYNSNHAEIIFPFRNTTSFTTLNNINKKYYWIPDLQEKYYPDYFSKEELKQREEIAQQITSSKETLILSSVSVKRDIEKFYPDSKCDVKVLHFVSFVDKEKIITKEEILRKYNIPSSYFIVSNQFWQHKNHLLVLKSINKLKELNYNFLVVFTGKENDYRNKNYVEELKIFVSSHKIESYVRFLGFIPRNDQLSLIKYSLAVIQPSIFEGWSTIVEDVKALNKLILISDIPVHREQINNNCIFFTPFKEEVLAELMIDVLNHPPVVHWNDYNYNISKFSEDLYNIFCKY